MVHPSGGMDASRGEWPTDSGQGPREGVTLPAGLGIFHFLAEHLPDWQ